MDRHRVVRLIVITSSGEVRGITEPLPCALPWWQETEPIAELIPGSRVLRLVDGTPDGQSPRGGGEVTYLTEHDGPVRLSLQPTDFSVVPHPLRHSWANPGGPTADLEWVAEHVEVTGSATQHRSWNLSAIWSIPTTSGTVWLKCVPSFFAHESAVLERLPVGAGPRLIAAEGHRLLLAEMPGEDGYEGTEPERMTMIEELVGIQAALTDDVDHLVAAGVPDHRSGRLATALADLVDRQAPNSAPLRRFVDQLPDRLAQLDGCGIPDTLVHGDAHAGNCRRGTTPPVWFDWGDSFIGNPILDLAAHQSMSLTVVRRWLDIWANAIPGSDPVRAWALAEDVARLRLAWVYDRFCRNIEPTERVYHQGDIGDALATLEAKLATNP